LLVESHCGLDAGFRVSHRLGGGIVRGVGVGLSCLAGSVISSLGVGTGLIGPGFSGATGCIASLIRGSGRASCGIVDSISRVTSAGVISGAIGVAIRTSLSVSLSTIGLSRISCAVGSDTSNRHALSVGLCSI
jgi:hypothetical protein